MSKSQSAKSDIHDVSSSSCPKDELCQFLPGMTTVIEEGLRTYASDNGLLRELEEAINYSLFSGGKRIRPLLCFLVGELFNVSKEGILSLACALEMIHTASLIVDDLPQMDDARTRRGKPSNHLVFGEDVAILAAIALLSRAFEIVLADRQLRTERKLPVLLKLTQVVGAQGMVGGQFLDLKKPTQSARVGGLEVTNTRKTASLFVAAAETAAMVGCAPPSEVLAIKNFSNHLGVAFQVRDDILDNECSGASHFSIAQRSSKIVRRLGVIEARRMLTKHSAAATQALEIFNERSPKLLLFARFALRDS
jgi:geranylgeranyl diphosphate synthase, type II